MSKKPKKYVKESLNLSVDPRLIKELDRLGVNKSALFSDAALELIKSNGGDISIYNDK